MIWDLIDMMYLANLCALVNTTPSTNTPTYIYIKNGAILHDLDNGCFLPSYHQPLIHQYSYAQTPSNTTSHNSNSKRRKQNIKSSSDTYKIYVYGLSIQKTLTSLQHQYRQERGEPQPLGGEIRALRSIHPSIQFKICA